MDDERASEEDIKVAEVIDTALELDAPALDYLIGLNREDERLDFKGQCDLSKASRKDKVELVRDIFAMSNTEAGGWIIVGVEEAKTKSGKRFNPVGLAAEAQVLFDESILRQQVEKYTDTLVRFESALVESVNYSSVFGVIRVSSAMEVPLLFKIDGKYKDEHGKEQTVFRETEAYVRRGTRSVRANQDDWRRFKSRIRRRERDLWTEESLGLRELTGAIRELVSVLGANGVGNPRPPTVEEVAAPLEEFIRLFEKHTQ